MTERGLEIHNETLLQCHIIRRSQDQKQEEITAEVPLDSRLPLLLAVRGAAKFSRGLYCNNTRSAVLSFQSRTMEVLWVPVR